MSRWIKADALLEYWKPDQGRKFDASYFIYTIECAPSIDIVRCAECRWARPRTLKGETGYRCIFYCTDKAENGYCDNGEREGE